jgi:hypothetical protein
MTSYDYVHSKPDAGWVSFPSDHVVVSGLISEGRDRGALDYVAYIADARELSDRDAGSPLQGDVSMTLPAGEYDVALYSPVTGGYSPAIKVAGGAKTTLALPSFTQDIVIRVTRAH